MFAAKPRPLGSRVASRWRKHDASLPPWHDDAHRLPANACGTDNARCHTVPHRRSQLPLSVRIERGSARLLVVGMTIALVAAVVYQPCCWCGGTRDVASQLLAAAAVPAIAVADACGLVSAAWSAIAHAKHRTRGLQHVLGWMLVIAVQMSLPLAIDLVVEVHQTIDRL